MAVRGRKPKPTALKVLEGGSGCLLFERSSRGLQPTVASRDILFPIRRALNELRLLDSDLSAMQGTLRGVVHVGALPLGRSRILPGRWIWGWTRQRPERGAERRRIAGL